MSTAIRGSTSKPTSKFDESSTLALGHTDTPCPRTGDIFTKNDQPRLVSNVSSAHCSWPQHILPRNKTHNHLRNVSPFSVLLFFRSSWLFTGSIESWSSHGNTHASTTGTFLPLQRKEKEKNRVSRSKEVSLFRVLRAPVSPSLSFSFYLYLYL